MKNDDISIFDVNNSSVNKAASAAVNKLSPPVMFNNKSFNNKVHLSLEMATYWDLSLVLMRSEFYKVVCFDDNFIHELDALKANNQYDIVLLKFLHYLNPSLSDTLKKIVEEDINSSQDDILAEKGKLKYRGGELIPPNIYNKETFTIDSLPTEGANLFTKDKTPLVVGGYLGDGGEGIVYKSSRKNEVVKLIKPDNHGRIRVSVQRRLEQMVQMKITNPNIIWPLDTVYNERGQFVGFTMKFISGIDLKKFTSSIVKNVNDNSDEININDIDKKSLCKLILSILDTIIYLHDKNIVIGDIKLENFMIKDNDISNIYFIDCDSYQIGNYPSLLVSPGFVPPELDAANLGRANCRFRTFGNENFALFSLIFHLVFRARPPYSQQIHDDSYMAESVRVTKGLFPYFLDKETTLHHAPKGMEEPIWAHLPSYVKKAFINCGSRSGENFGEENRLSAKQWKSIFTCYLDDLNSKKLSSKDPLCNRYHYGLKNSIEYHLVDYNMPPDALTKTKTSIEETVSQRFRNNDYIKNMILTQNINVHDFNYTMFNNKLFNNKVLLSLELVKNWHIGLEFLRTEPLTMFGISPADFSKITSNKAKRNYELALFNFIKALNKDIFLAYDGLIFNTLGEYSKYLNDYFYFQDKSVIPFEIIEEAVEDKSVINLLKPIYTKSNMTNDDLDIIINLISENMICADGEKYETLGEYIGSILDEEMSIKSNSILLDPSLGPIIFRKNKLDITRYDLSKKETYYELASRLLGYIPFKFNGEVFKCLEDFIKYSNCDLPHEVRFTDIGRWINSGLLKQYLSYYPIDKKKQSKFDVFGISYENKLDDWETGNLFYLANIDKPKYITRSNIQVNNLKELMEILTEVNDLDSFSEMLYSNCLFEKWCEFHTKQK